MQITDLDSAHTANRGWIDSENEKISAWGKGEIKQIVERTRGMEQQLVEAAKIKQRELDEAHVKELQQKVQAMDLQKAAALKELQDSMQQQIQVSDALHSATSKREAVSASFRLRPQTHSTLPLCCMLVTPQAQLTKSKSEINRIESEINTKKMDLLKQSQLRSAKEVDQMSNLVCEAKLVPSKTRTVIETKTDTGNVIAVATGGNISTGSAQSENYSSQRMAAVPNLGQVQQQSAYVKGDLVEDRTGRKVGAGEGAATVTEVVKQHSDRAVDPQQQSQANSAMVNPLATSGPGIHANPQHKTVDAAYGKHQESAASDKSRIAHASEPTSTDATKRV